MGCPGGPEGRQRELDLRLGDTSFLQPIEVPSISKLVTPTASFWSCAEAVPEFCDASRGAVDQSDWEMWGADEGLVFLESVGSAFVLERARGVPLN